MNFEGTYLRDGWVDSTKIGMDCVLPQGTFHSKNVAVLFRHYQVTDA